MSPQLENLISKLARRGLSEEQIYANLKQSNKIKEPYTLADIYGYMAKERMAATILGRDQPNKAIKRRIFGVLCLSGALFTLVFIYLPDSGRLGQKVGGYALLLALLGLILILKPHATID